MSILRKKLAFENHFTQIPNTWLRDARLSWKARGLLAHLMSHRPGWEVTLESLASVGPDGITAIRAAVAELEECGYLKRERLRSPDGTRLAGVNYELMDPAESLGSENLTQGFDTQGNQTPKKNIPTEEQSSELTPLPGLEIVSRETDERSAIEAAFEVFWHQWPKKVARIDAVKVWKKLKPADRAEALAGAIRVKAMVDQKQVEKTYLPNPDRWLRGRRWEDFQAKESESTGVSPAPVSLSAVRYHDTPHPGLQLTDQERAAALRRWPDPTGWGEISREHAQMIIDERTGHNAGHNRPRSSGPSGLPAPQ